MTNEAKLDVAFRLTGQRMPVDHGFSLYGAVSRTLPVFHQDQDVGMKRVRGRYIGDGLLDISPTAELVFRMPISRIGHYLNLAGKRLDVEGHPLQIGVPNTRALVPAVALYAHLVTTKNGNDPARFETEIGRQLAALDIRGRFDVGKRRTFQVHGKQVVGYSMLVSELTAEESIALQETGVGGRRKMGCGFFQPWKG
jgi:CRISPR-associated protein Cas6